MGELVDRLADDLQVDLCLSNHDRRVVLKALKDVAAAAAKLALERSEALVRSLERL